MLTHLLDARKFIYQLSCAKKIQKTINDNIFLLNEYANANFCCGIQLFIALKELSINQ